MYSKASGAELNSILVKNTECMYIPQLQHSMLSSVQIQ